MTKSISSSLYLSDKVIALEPVFFADITNDFVSWLKDEEVVTFSRQKYQCHSIEKSQAYWNSFQDTKNLFLKIVKIKETKIIGSMTAYFDESNTNVDIGILIGEKTVWGKGFGFRAWTR